MIKTSNVRRWFRRRAVARTEHGPRALELHDQLDGLLAMEESAFLFSQAHGRKQMLEVGSHRGKSAVLMALGSAGVGGRVTAIDCYDGPDTRGGGGPHEQHLAHFDAELAKRGIADRVTIKVLTSHAARREWDDTPIDMLWIDGDHSYEGSRMDFDLWGPLVAPGGIIAAHDYTHDEGVKRSFDELIGASDDWGPTGQVRSIAWAKRLK